MMNINTIDGKIKIIKIEKMPALEGWQIQNDYVDFVRSKDRDYRRSFTLGILSYAKIVLAEIELPLSTDALIDNHLQTWQNIQLVFEEVLRQNGIDPETHAEKPNYWDLVGREIATAFVAEATQLVAPALAMLKTEEK